MTPFSMDTTATLAQLGFDIKSFFMILFVVVSVIMILIVLIQRPQGGGLSGAFGAAADGAGQTAFGAKTGDALTLATVTTFLIFLGTAIALNFSLRPDELVLQDAAVESATVEDEPADPLVDDLDTVFGGGGAQDTPSNVITPQRLETDEDGQPVLPSGEPLELPETAPAAPPTDDPSGG